MRDDGKLPIVKGRVKWFNLQRQYGFIVSEKDEDILIHQNALREIGLSSLAEGTEVEVSIHEDQGRKQVASIFSVIPPHHADIIGKNAVAIPQEVLETTPTVPARVKWYSLPKGYGFANIFGKKYDVFLPANAVQAAGLSGLVAGEAIAIKAIESERGWTAVQILRWPEAK